MHIRDVLYIIYNILFTPMYAHARTHVYGGGVERRVPCVNAHGCEAARACNPTRINRFGNAVYAHVHDALVPAGPPSAHRDVREAAGACACT